MRGIMDWFRSRKLERDVARGRKQWGRQPPPTHRGREPGGSMPVKTRANATIAAVVTRADGTVEDLGVLWKGRV